MIKQLSSVEKVHYKIKFGWSLESIVEFYNKWAVDLLEDISLSYANLLLGIKTYPEF